MDLNPDKLNPRKLDEIDDDEIRVLGDSDLIECCESRFPALDKYSPEEILQIINETQNKKKKRLIWRWIIIAVIAIGVIIATLVAIKSISADSPDDKEENETSEILSYTPKSIEIQEQPIVDSQPAYTDISDTIVNGIQLRIFSPQNATATLNIGPYNKADSSIVLISQAADIRADNKDIVGRNNHLFRSLLQIEASFLLIRE